METVTAGALSSSSSSYVEWKEVFVLGNKRRRGVHYYLMRKDGASDLAVVGKEKSPRHINFRYVVQERFLIGCSSPSLFPNLRSRREVIDWLNSIVQDCHAEVDVSTGFGSFDERDAGSLTLGRPLKDVQMQKVCQYGKQLVWLGSSWMCKKKRTHYQSFCRNGFKISVNDFVLVLAEDNKRLVAHLEDMYVDSQGNKMVVVRWFHRIDEVDIDLPHKFSDREIFFSLCLQDINIECIDGLAVVLSPLHFDKYMNDVRDSWVHPFMCQSLFDDCDIKPFDITQIKGYWTQYLLHRLFSTLGSRPSDKSYGPDHNMNVKELDNSRLISRPRKRLSLMGDSRIGMQHGIKKGGVVSLPSLNGKNSIPREGLSVKEKQLSSLPLGCQVEVLSQDSGIRGCWFRASIIKKHKDKIKVQYCDLQDADSEVNHLEEWVSSSRIAVDDKLALRINGRTTVRPLPQPRSGRVSWSFDVGSLVDAWWHDGWWEGIVIGKESNEKVLVYFPGEKRQAVFCLGELRHSQEWLGSTWKDLHGREDVATELLSSLDHGKGNKAYESKTEEPSAGNNILQDNFLHKIEACSSISQLDNSDRETNGLALACDLSKDKILAQLQWKSSRKRSRAGHFVNSHHMQLQKTMNGLKSQNFLAPAPPNSLKVDHENCKYMGDSLFNSSAAPPVRTLVMSR